MILGCFYTLSDTMSTGKTIAVLRKQKNWSQTGLANESNISRMMIGKYERDEPSPSIDAAKKTVDSLGVSLDALVGEEVNTNFDKVALSRIQTVLEMDESKKNVLLDLIDTYIRDYKTKKAYAS